MGLEAAHTMACTKLAAGSATFLVTVRFVAPGKIEPGGGGRIGIATPVAAGKMVAEGEPVLVVVGDLASGKL